MQVADLLRAEVSQVGKAFSKILSHHPEIGLYNSDNHHQSYAGAMLSAYVHAATVLGVDVRQCGFDGTLDAERAAVLKQTAYSVVNESK